MSDSGVFVCLFLQNLKMHLTVLVIFQVRTF